MKKPEEIKKIVKEKYGEIAAKSSGCGCGCSCGGQSNEQIAKSIGYSEEEISTVSEANLGLGCGNPVAMGEIEKLPVEDNSIDVAISNCVINLVPDKKKAFKEIFRVLKKGGKMYISDIVLLENLSEEQKNNEGLLAGCVGGALLKDDYLKIIKDAGFVVKSLSEDKDISKRQYQGIALESLKIEARK